MRGTTKVPPLYRVRTTEVPPLYRVRAIEVPPLYQVHATVKANLLTFYSPSQVEYEPSRGSVSLHGTVGDEEVFFDHRGPFGNARPVLLQNKQDAGMD